MAQIRARPTRVHVPVLIFNWMGTGRPAGLRGSGLFRRECLYTYYCLYRIASFLNFIIIQRNS